MGIFELEKLIAIEEATELVTERVTELVTVRVTEQVREQNARIFVTNLLTATDFSEEKIASLAQVNVEFVLKVRKDLTGV